MKILVATAAALLATGATGQPAAPATDSATLTVQFEGIENLSGQVMLSLYNDQAAHDGGGKPIMSASIKVKGDSPSVSFTGLAPGRYAIKAFHDLNGDGELNTNPFGMPLEPYAFSNNAKPDFGPARWHATSFTVVVGQNAQRITIK